MLKKLSYLSVAVAVFMAAAALAADSISDNELHIRILAPGWMITRVPCNHGSHRYNSKDGRRAILSGETFRGPDCTIELRNGPNMANVRFQQNLSVIYGVAPEIYVTNQAHGATTDWIADVTKFTEGASVNEQVGGSYKHGIVNIDSFTPPPKWE